MKRETFNLPAEIDRETKLYLLMRGNCYPKDTESDIDDLLKAAEVARQHVLFTIPDYLRPDPNRTPGWFFSLKDGIFQRFGEKHYPEDPMRSDEEDFNKKYPGCRNSWSGD